MTRKNFFPVSIVLSLFFVLLFAVEPMTLLINAMEQTRR